MNIRCIPSHIGGEIKANNTDISNIFLLCAGALSARGVTLNGFKPDAFAEKILNISDYMGANVNFDEKGVTVSKNRLFGMMATVNGDEKLFSVYFALSALAEQRFTHISGIKSLDIRKVNSVVENLTKLRVACTFDDEDELIIWGGNDIVGGTVDAENNVYFALAYVLISCEAKIPLDILNAGDLQKEFPDFISNWNNLGGKIEIIK